MIPVDDAPLTIPELAALAGNLGRVRTRIASACARAGRDPREVGLVVVTKYTGAHVARALVELGQVDLGENRADRIEAMAAAVPGARWHMVGHLQRNKAKQVASRISVLHSLESLDLATKLEQLRPDMVKVLITAAAGDRIESFRRNHEVHYIRKPLDFPRLLRLLGDTPRSHC